MLGFLIQRLIQALAVMLVMSALVFIGVYAVGNPIDVLISPDATQDIRQRTIEAYGLDRPLYEQYFTFLGNLLHGDFGRSFVFGMPVLQLILSRLPATLELTLAAVLGATLGLLSADLREKLMLGDAGSNVVGAVVATGVVLTTSATTRVVVLVVVLALNLLSEKVSFSRVIDSVGQFSIPIDGAPAGGCSSTRSWPRASFDAFCSGVR